MMLSSEDEGLPDGAAPHPYVYAWVIGIYHAEVRHESPHAPTSMPQVMQFLWVRWFGHNLEHWGRWKAQRLHQIGFVPDDLQGGTFGFIDLTEVICGVHLILAFAHEKTDELLGPSIAWPQKDADEDWRYFYVNM